MKWANELVIYLAVLNAIYVDFMENDRIDKHAWTNELKNIQPLVLMAGRKLAKGHYRDLEKRTGMVEGPFFHSGGDQHLQTLL